MNVSYSRYELNPWSDRGTLIGRPRSGALLRVDFGFGQVGYADCHPWTEFGDLSLDTQLQALRIGANTPILERAMAFARLDATARSQGISLLEGAYFPPSHASLPYSLTRRPYQGIPASQFEWIVAVGFDTIKLKVGHAPVAEIQQLAKMAPVFRERGVKIRLDFNERLSYEDFVGFLEGVAQETAQDLAWIDWLEDPCPYDPQTWFKIQATFGIAVALDRAMGRTAEEPTQGFDVLVVKPAVQDPDVLFDLAASLGIPVAITSYLDHPLGQVCAAWVSAQAGLRNVAQVQGGLASHIAYEPNDFSCDLGIAGGRLLPPSGIGFGFEEALLEQEWEELR